MNPVNLGSVPATTGRVHATIGRVPGRIGQVLGRIDRVPVTAGGVPVTVGRRREEIAAEYHTCLTPYTVEYGTSDMCHEWIRYV
jgi:hypothetical protein